MKEIFQPLNRCFIHSTACRKCGRLYFALKYDARKWMIAFEIFLLNGYKKCSVGISAVPSIFTHSVCYQTVFLRRRRNYRSTRAHAERIYAPAVFQMHYHPIISRPKCRVTSETSILNFID